MVEKINLFSTATKYPYTSTNRCNVPSFKAQTDKPDSFEKTTLSTGAKIGISSIIALGIAVLGDLIFAKGKHLRAIFTRGNNVKTTEKTGEALGEKAGEATSHITQPMKDLQEAIWTKACETETLSKLQQKKLSVGNSSASSIAMILGFLNKTEELAEKDIRRILGGGINNVKLVFLSKFPNRTIKISKAEPSMSKETFLHNIGTNIEDLKSCLDSFSKEQAKLNKQNNLPGVKLCDAIDSVFQSDEWKKLEALTDDVLDNNTHMDECRDLLGKINIKLKQALQEKGIDIRYYSQNAPQKDVQGSTCFLQAPDDMPARPLLIDKDTDLLLAQGFYKK